MPAWGKGTVLLAPKHKMGSSGNTITDGFNAVTLVGSVVFAFLVTGCSVAGNTLPQLSSPDEIVTNSVVTRAKPDGLAETDAEILKSTVATAPVAGNPKPLAWNNPQTGTSGTIVAIDKFLGKHGQACRGFKTSVSSFAGVGFYNGEACQVSSEKWVLSWFKIADDS